MRKPKRRGVNRRNYGCEAREYCGERQQRCYARQNAAENQRKSHDPSWQAMNRHLRAHLFGGEG